MSEEETTARVPVEEIETRPDVNWVLMEMEIRVRRRFPVERVIKVPVIEVICIGPVVDVLSDWRLIAEVSMGTVLASLLFVAPATT